ncbi:MAG TPA: DNA primase [Terriglobales bacterium]|nr:DNA primase [Terriglobales bacterium]
MSEFTNQLKAKADIGRLIGEFVALKPGGSGYVGLCPFHSEKTPSFHVHRARQFYYCFGCHAHGDIFQFFMQLRHLTFPEAVEQVAERLGVTVPRQGAGEGDPQRQELLRIHASAQIYFERRLAAPEGAAARAYLAERELEPAAARFQLGYAPEGGRGLALHLQAEGYTPDQALRAGLCQLRRESGGERAPEAPAWTDLYDRFRQRLMFPIADERGRVIAFGGRALALDPTGKTPKYLNSPESPLYTKGRVLYNLDRAREAIRQLGYVILVEGYFDCIRVFEAGFENVVASCGTALTAAQIAPVARLSKKAVINFDPDAAGAAAAERSIGLLLEEGFAMRVVVLEGGLDPDLYVRRRGAAAYGEALKGSRSFFDYLAERARRQYDLRRGEGKVAALNHLLPYLSRVHDPILRQNLAENLAVELGIEAGLLSQQLARAARERRAQMPAASPGAASEMLYAERVILRALAEWPERRASLGGMLQQEELLQGLPSEGVAGALRAAGEGLATWEEMTEGWEAADRLWLAQALLSPQGEAELSEPVLAGALAALRERRAGKQTRELQGRIQQAAARGDRVELEGLLREKAAWDARLRQPEGEPGGGAAATGG